MASSLRDGRKDREIYSVEVGKHGKENTIVIRTSLLYPPFRPYAFFSPDRHVL
jgi:hypothetical protein